jgi:hypothetical protein
MISNIGLNNKGAGLMLAWDAIVSSARHRAKRTGQART